MKLSNAPVLVMAVLIVMGVSGCAAGPTQEDLSAAARCLELIGMSDVRVSNDQVWYTVDAAEADLPTTTAAIAACKPNATPDSVFKAVSE